jgi:uncharacterized protein YdaU (DUF1376 family)
LTIVSSSRLLVMNPDEPESARLDREIAALLQKKAAAQAKEQQRAKVENARRANILVENSPVKKKTRECTLSSAASVLGIDEFVAPSNSWFPI